MKTNEALAGQLTAALGLALPPVAVLFCDQIPTGVAPFQGRVPAGCVFWQQGAAGTFATSTPDHETCAIGVHTHHMAQPTPAFPGELGEVLKVMTGMDYVRDEEVAGLPVMAKETRHVVYGPLAEQAADPDLVLIFAHAAQGLILSEALQRVDGATPTAMGRPACAALPQVMNQGVAAVSMGCCGARAYLDRFTDDVALWVLPGGKLAAYCEQVQKFADANRTLGVFHARRREDVENGKTPTVRESLARM